MVRAEGKTALLLQDILCKCLPVSRIHHPVDDTVLKEGGAGLSKQVP